MNAAKSGLNKITDNLIKPSSPVKSVVLAYAVVILLAIVLYMGAWIWLFYTQGKPDLPQLLSFLHEVVSSPFVLAISFLGGCFIDLDHDGVPDAIEKDKGRRSEQEDYNNLEDRK